MEHVQIITSKNELPKSVALKDIVPGAIEELISIRTPHIKSLSDQERALYIKEHVGKYDDIETVYVYYPWRNLAIRTVGEALYTELRTARNKNIITQEEQEKYRALRVGIGGLSIGLNVLSALVFSGGPKFLKIADYDTIEITNLNRLRASLVDIGVNKTIFASRYVWELDPFAEIEPWENGIMIEDLEKFICQPKLDVFIDEMDSLEIKLQARIICREQGIPVVMATDNGDNIILDIERFDQDNTRPILHGLVEGVDPASIADLPYNQWLEIATRIVDPKNLTVRMQESLKEIGKSIAAVPQLGTTATIAGASVAYAVRQIATGETLPSGRYILDLDTSFHSSIL